MGSEGSAPYWLRNSTYAIISDSQPPILGGEQGVSEIKGNLPKMNAL